MARRVKVVTKKWRNIEGFDELEAKLEALASSEEKNSQIRYEIRAVLQKAGIHVRDAAVSFAPAHPENIKQAIISAFGADKKKDASTVVMALFSKSPWWHWWEFGTSERFTKSGASRGAIKATKFFRRGVATARPAVASEVAQGLRKIIESFGT